MTETSKKTISPAAGSHWGRFTHPRLDSPQDALSSQRTRAALGILEDCPTDAAALHDLWEDNRAAFETHMWHHLDAPSTTALAERVLAGVVSVTKFYCDEIDDPKAWVARCSNLETRRVALQLRK